MYLDHTFARKTFAQWKSLHFLA